MYFVVRRTETISLAPEYFGGDVRDRLFTLLKAKVEGKCHGVWGYTVFVHPDLVNPSAGVLDIDTGCAVYNVDYVSLVFRPFKNEILMAEVASLSSLGLFCKVAGFEMFISVSSMPNHFSFRHAGGEPCFYSTVDGAEIKPRCSLRVRIAGLRQGAESMSGIASINEDYLGLMGQ